jgi:hypothetical protein
VPIYVYVCPEGHRTEFLKMGKDEKEPTFCNQPRYYARHHTGPCGLPLTKIIEGTSWKYTRGKNVKWPQ